MIHYPQHSTILFATLVQQIRRFYYFTSIKLIFILVLKSVITDSLFLKKMTYLFVPWFI